ncbi:uncharacterized protein LOC114535003 isoform X2 [Dendronephthya gigantea]|nr:uncharacterized protein LOC114535003 isoform X2 [Dendronephthya gigantea]XP_028412183.1 uncharacterized protein LOC114535003 isoform X2 [Dendronephthya gigantea]
MCINDTGIIQSNGSWGNLSFLALSDDSCLHLTAQFRFRENGAMLNLNRQGCLAGGSLSGSGFNLDLLYLYVDSVSLDTAACAQNPNNGIYRAINQTTWGALSVYYKGYGKSLFETWCASYEYNNQLHRKYGISQHVGLSTSCDTWNQRFILGSVTCYGDMVKNANCPRNQYMVVKIASFRGLLATKTCGLSLTDYSCELDVTCLVKKQCDGLHECSIRVDETLFSSSGCPGLKTYLYFEYHCTDTVKTFKGPCIHDVSLSHSYLPFKGVVQISTDSGTMDVCWKSLKKYPDAHMLCRSLGYDDLNSFVNVSVPANSKHAVFSGTFTCSDQEKSLSQCLIVASNQTCSELTYIECSFHDYYIFWDNFSPLLATDKKRFPDSSFSASASVKGHNPFDARISSGSSWCAPVSDAKHYLQVDLGTLYWLFHLITYGDSNSPKWVATYNLNHTSDLVSWKAYSSRIFQGNKNAYHHAANAERYFFYLDTRALRFIPLAYVGQPCMRVDTSGYAVLPFKPENLTANNITSRSVDVSWLDPENPNDGGSWERRVSRFFIILTKDNSPILNITTNKSVHKYEIDSLIPFTTYEISVSAGNRNGYGRKAIILFSTSEEAPSGPPLNIKATSRNASSLLLVWDPPEKNKQNGNITSYTACLSHSKNGSCFHTFITSEREWLLGNLSPATKYYFSVLASNKVGSGNYSNRKGIFTNGRAVKKAIGATPNTLTFSLEIPTITFKRFYVVTWKVKDDEKPLSSDRYENNELVMFAEAENSTNPQPYIAAVFSSSNIMENMFVLGDGRSTSDSTSYSSGFKEYFNAPLEPGTRYSIFQRIIINDKGDYYSTDWSPVSQTTNHPGKEMRIKIESRNKITRWQQ